MNNLVEKTCFLCQVSMMINPDGDIINPCVWCALNICRACRPNIDLANPPAICHPCFEKIPAFIRSHSDISILEHVLLAIDTSSYNRLHLAKKIIILGHNTTNDYFITGHDTEDSVKETLVAWHMEGRFSEEYFTVDKIVENGGCLMFDIECNVIIKKALLF